MVSIAAVVVVLALVAVVVVVGRGGDDASGIDKCVVGNWTVVSARMEVTTADYGVMRFASVGNVGKIKLGSDGKGYTDYGSNAEFGADVTGPEGSGKLSLKITGITRYDFSTKDSTLSYSNVRNDSKITMTVVATGASSSPQFEIMGSTTTYSCQDQTLTTFTDTQRSEARRGGS